MNRLICFVTVIDLRQETAGAVINDLKILRCLRKFGNVDVISLQKKRLRSSFFALPLFFVQILRSFSKPYDLYLSRGLIASFTLLFCKPFHRKKVIHRNLFGAFSATKEARYMFCETKHLLFIRLESFFRFLFYSVVEKIVLHNADAVTVAAQEYADELSQVGVSSDQIYIVPFYVESEFFQQPFSSRAGNTFRFCYAGNFQPYHELLPLIKAFELLGESEKRIDLLLVGDGPMRPRVQEEVKKRKLTDRILFFGRVSHKSLPSILSRVDSFVLLIRARGISTSLLEAAAAGKAIITYRRKQDLVLNRFFKHLKHIYMVESISPTQIAEGMRLVYLNSKLRETLGKGARRIAQLYFSEEYASHQLQQMIRRTCKDFG